MATTAIPHFEPFSVDLAPSTLAARWTTRFENLMTAMNVTDPARKKAMLLHLVGERVYDIYDGLIVPDVPADADPAENNVYIAARKALDDHFSPKKNADFDIYNFRLAKQLQHETVDTYHARLFRQHLYTFLRAYRSTPHTTTQKSPAELLFGAPRSFHTRLPELTDERQASDEVRQTDKQNKQKMKQYRPTQTEGITRQLHS